MNMHYQMGTCIRRPCTVKNYQSPLLTTSVQVYKEVFAPLKRRLLSSCTHQHAFCQPAWGLLDLQISLGCRAGCTSFSSATVVRS